MCYRPLTIKNNVKNLDHFIDRSILHVPCGKCIQCLNEKRLSWFIRLYYEWLSYKLNGGYALYITLTYNSSCVPTKYGHLCFSKKDIQNYVKKIRKRIKEDIKYFVVSEYGGTTHRPHYHCLFFIPSGITSSVATRIIRKCWSFGFTKMGKYNRGVVNSHLGIMYVTKYITKEDSWIPKLEKDLLLEGYDENGDAIDFRYFKPFFLNSNNLGVYALSCTDYKELQNGNIFLPDPLLIQKSYKLPLYLDRKLHYDVKFKNYDPFEETYYVTDKRVNKDSTPFYVPNELGRKAIIHRIDKYINAFQSIVDTFLEIPNDYNLIHEFNDKFQTNFANIHQMRDFLIKKDVIPQMAVYNVIYRGYHYYDAPFDADALQTDYETDFEQRILIKGGQKPNLDLLQGYCNNLHYFDYEEKIDLYSDMVTFCVRYYKTVLEEKDRRKQKTLRDNTNLYLKFHHV